MTKPSAFESMICAGFVLAFGTCAPALATTYVVETTIESVVGDGLCGLRESIKAASSDAAWDTCPAGAPTDEIFLPSGTYQFDISEESVGGPGTLLIEGADGVTIDLGGNQCLGKDCIRF